MKSSKPLTLAPRPTTFTTGPFLPNGQRGIGSPSPATKSGGRTIQRISVTEITVGAGHRQLDEDHVAELQESIKRIGLTSPIVVVDALGVITLIAGQHRLKAAQSLGSTHIDAFVLDANDPKNRLLTLSENLHRLGLSALDRAEQENEWLQAFQHEAAQVAHPVGGHQPNEQGIGKTSRKLDVSRRELERAQKIAAISPEAKLRAREFKLHKNQSALLKIAEGKSAEEQQKIAAAIVERKKLKPHERRSTTSPSALTANEKSLPSVDWTGTSAIPQTDDTGITEFLKRRDPNKAFQEIVAAWNAAPQLKLTWADAPSVARSRFAIEVLRIVPSELSEAHHGQ